MQSTTTPKYLTCGEAAQRLPNRPSACCVWRWARKGIKSRSGETVRLKHYRLGGKVYTTEADLHEFFASLAAEDGKHFDSQPADPPRPETNGHAGRRQHTEAVLRKAGILR